MKHILVLLTILVMAPLTARHAAEVADKPSEKASSVLLDLPYVDGGKVSKLHSPPRQRIRRASSCFPTPITTSFATGSGPAKP